MQNWQKKTINKLLQADDLLPQAPFQLNFEIPMLIGNVNTREEFSEMICKSTYENEDLSNIMRLLAPENEATFKQPIVIVGRAQIGKTQLLKKLLEHARNEKLYDYIFYVSLTNVNLSDEMNVLQMLTMNKSSLRWIDCQTDSDRQLLKRVVENLADASQSKVCIIFDDFEKSDFFNVDYPYDQSIFDLLEAGALVSSTIRSWFSDSQKMLLLQPWSYLQLTKTPSLRTMRMIYVQGISHASKNAEESLGLGLKPHADEQCSVCQCCHSGNCRLEIQSLCSAPNNWKLLKQNLSSVQDSSTVKIAVELLRTALTEAFSEYQQDPTRSSEALKKSTRFAWKHYVQNTFIFNESELTTSGLSANDINILFSCGRKKKNFFRDYFVFFFSHVLLQEMLATMWLLSIPTKELQAELSACRKLLSQETKYAVICDCLSEICEISSEDEGNLVPPLQSNPENIPLLKDYFGTVIFTSEPTLTVFEIKVKCAGFQKYY